MDEEGAGVILPGEHVEGFHVLWCMGLAGGRKDENGGNIR